MGYIYDLSGVNQRMLAVLNGCLFCGRFANINVSSEINSPGEHTLLI